MQRPWGGTWLVFPGPDSPHNPALSPLGTLVSHQELGSSGLCAVSWLSHSHDTGERVLSPQQMMPSHPTLLLGPNNPSESLPCGSWEGSRVLGQSTADVGSRAVLCLTRVYRGRAEGRRGLCSVPRAAVTQYHKRDGLTPCKHVLSQFWRLAAQLRGVGRACALSQLQGKALPGLFLRSAAAGIPRLSRQRHPSLCLPISFLS